MHFRTAALRVLPENAPFLNTCVSNSLSTFIVPVGWVPAGSGQNRSDLHQIRVIVFHLNGMWISMEAGIYIWAQCNVIYYNITFRVIYYQVDILLCKHLLLLCFPAEVEIIIQYFVETHLDNPFIWLSRCVFPVIKDFNNTATVYAGSSTIYGHPEGHLAVLLLWGHSPPRHRCNHIRILHCPCCETLGIASLRWC